MGGYKYFWTCPNCGTSLQLKMRATQTKRKCPHCGYLVTPEEIDRQGRYAAIGCLIVIGLVWLLCSVPAGTIVGFFQGLFYFLIALVVLAVVGFIAYIAYKTYEDRNYELEKLRFFDSPDFQLIRDFAMSDLRHESKSHEKLHTLLTDKGWKFNKEHVEAFVADETATQSALLEESEISNQIRATRPVAREDYLKAYLELPTSNQEKYLHVLAKLLSEPNLNEPKLRDELMQLSKRTEMEEFERKLRGKSP